jgi:hypothetical protein
MSDTDGFNLPEAPERQGDRTSPLEGCWRPAKPRRGRAAPGSPVNSARNATIDLFRVIAIFGVIVVHTDPVTRKVFTSAPEHLANLMITGAGRAGGAVLLRGVGFLL